MLKKMTTVLVTLFLTLGLSAQPFTGGIKGTVISRTDRTPVAGATLTLSSGNEVVAVLSSSPDGTFIVNELSDGVYDLVIQAPDFLDMRVNVTVNDGYVKNMFNLSLTPELVVSTADPDNFEEFDLEDTGYSDSPTVLYGQNDAFNQVSYNFSAVRFRPRGFSSETQDVYLAGVKMNDALTGYGPYSLWSGLNEATRMKTSFLGAEPGDFAIGGYNGITHVHGNATNVRKGWRGSVMTSSAMYRLRLMLSYASGRMDNGWAYAFNVSTRLGGNDWIKGVYYRSFAYYGAVEKAFGDEHNLSFIFMAAPGERGAQNASTQEVYDLMGDNLYNSNWGYQNGKIRNSRVRRTHEPIAALKYDYTPSHSFSASLSAVYRFGKNGYTALDWYDAADPRPDYYRNLPSYFWDPGNEDLNRLNESKAYWAEEAWRNQIADIVHVNWDRFYQVNALNVIDGRKRSKYIQEERHTDQRDLGLAASFKWVPNEFVKLAGGADARLNRTENYKIVADLLGGDYYLDVDNFADRDFAAYPYMTQNDLDYFIANGEARKLKEGDKYGYDYLAQVRQVGGWLSGHLSWQGLDLSLSGRLGYTALWREGLLRKGLFPGLTEEGSQIKYNGEFITTYDSDGKPVTSYGKSEVKDFITYSGKAGLSYSFAGGNRLFANVGYFVDAPYFKHLFLSPRTRNSIIPDVKTKKTFAADANYQLSKGAYNLRVTAYYALLMDQSDLMSFYDDSQNSFTNFAMTGIDQRHIGVELGTRIPTPIDGLSLQGSLGWGEFVYTSNPRMYQTIDNSASVVEDTWGVVIPYWKSHPTAGGKTVRHFVSGTPQIAANIGLSWNKNYWFVDAGVDYFDKSYLSMNPLYRTDMATAGGDGIATIEEVEYMASQVRFDPAWLVNLSVGKSWFIKRKYSLGFSLNAKNLLNERNIKTGGYEQTRIVDRTSEKKVYYRFPEKYFYMTGFNYMLSVYFRF